MPAVHHHSSAQISADELSEQTGADSFDQEFEEEHAHVQKPKAKHVAAKKTKSATVELKKAAKPAHHEEMK